MDGETSFYRPWTATVYPIDYNPPANDFDYSNVTQVMEFIPPETGTFLIQCAPFQDGTDYNRVGNLTLRVQSEDGSGSGKFVSLLFRLKIPEYTHITPVRFYTDF